mgnify:CR=1 FL=1
MAARLVHLGAVGAAQKNGKRKVALFQFGNSLSFFIEYLDTGAVVLIDYEPDARTRARILEVEHCAALFGPFAAEKDSVCEITFFAEQRHVFFPEYSLLIRFPRLS